jgi:hypothetical protein
MAPTTRRAARPAARSTPRAQPTRKSENGTAAATEETTAATRPSQGRGRAREPPKATDGAERERRERENTEAPPVQKKKQKQKFIIGNLWEIKKICMGFLDQSNNENKKNQNPTVAVEILDFFVYRLV